MTKGEFLALPRVSSFFPLTFGSSEAKWLEMRGECSQCGRPIGDAYFRGTITHPFEDIYLLDAVGFCRECKLLTRYYYRMRSDMSLSGRHPKTGEWAIWEPRKSLWERIREWFSRRSP